MGGWPAAGTTESPEGRADAVPLSSGARLPLIGRRGSARFGGGGFLRPPACRCSVLSLQDSDPSSARVAMSLHPERLKPSQADPQPTFSSLADRMALGFSPGAAHAVSRAVRQVTDVLLFCQRLLILVSQRLFYIP